MLGVLCVRPRWFTSVSFSYSHCAAAPFDRLVRTAVGGGDGRDHSTVQTLPAKCRAAASVWHTILPCRRHRRTAVLSRHENEAVLKGGEGSWNVAWDARPARWLHHPDSAWILFGVCASLAAAAAAPAIDPDYSNPEVVADELETDSSSNYRVTGEMIYDYHFFSIWFLQSLFFLFIIIIINCNLVL